MKNFKQLLVWQKGFDIALGCYQLTDTFPANEKFGLVSQINRAGVSIPSNIAEGSSRSSSKDYARFLEISLGSSYELETQLLLAQKLELGSAGILQHQLSMLDEEQRMLNAFI
jgi:four helix bundle protein